METTEKEPDPESYQKISHHITKTEVELKTILGESSISIKDFLNLQKNDVIVLNQPIDDPLKLFVNDELKFFVQPGKYKNKQAVQILKNIKGGNEGNE